MMALKPVKKTKQKTSHYTGAQGTQGSFIPFTIRKTKPNKKKKQMKDKKIYKMATTMTLKSVLKGLPSIQ